MSDIWDGYKQQTEFIRENGNKIVWCNGNTFLEYEPYITHPLAVMNMMDTEEEKIAAVLHDVFENNSAYQLSSMLTYEGSLYSILYIPEVNSVFSQQCYPINSSLWAILYTLIKQNDDWSKLKEKGCYQSYAGYIHYLCFNKTAIKVKIAGIVHNLSCSPSDYAKEKYLKAMPILLKSL